MNQVALQPASRSDSRLVPLLMVSFVATFAFSIVLPFLVFLVTRLGGNALVYGLIGATYPAFQFFGAPLMGLWSDRQGRKRVLLLSQGVTFVSWLATCAALLLPVTELARVHWLGEFTLTVPLVVLFGARALDGLAGGNVSVANAYVADISTDADRSRNFGRMGVAANLGLIAGPGLAAGLGATDLGYLLPVILATVLSGLACLLIAVWLPESTPCGLPSPSHRRRAAGTLGKEPLDCRGAAYVAARGTQGALKLPGVLFLAVLTFVVLLSFNLFYTAFPAYAVADLHWSVVDTSVFFGVLSFLLVLVEGPGLGWLAPRVRDVWLVIAGCALLGVDFLVMQSARTGWLYVGAALFALGNGIMWPTLDAIVAAAGGDRLQGAVQGLMGGVGSLAAILGLIAGGIAFELVGAETFVGSAVFAFLSALLAIRLLMRPIARQPAR